MSKGEQTREAILEKAVELFNAHGFSGVSLTDIMQATGLQKGGIYNHFTSKEELALEAFDYAFNRISELMGQAIKGKRDPLDRLIAIIEFYQHYFESPPFKGGCILFNTAVENDDSNPALCERARHAMSLWQELIIRTVQRGINQGEMRREINPELVATLIISTLEGSFILTKLHGDPVYIRRAVDHLLAYVESSVKA